MRIGIFGTGMVGRKLAARLTELGHELVIGTRDPKQTIARTEPDIYGNPPFHVWSDQHPKVKLETHEQAAVQGELLINATAGAGSLEALNLAGEANIGAKILIDIANPLDFSKGVPPTLFILKGDSLAEQIQRTFPTSKVVKTLNTMNATVMANPGAVADGDHSVFLSGNDGEAKTVVRGILRSFGWKDIIDLGDITTARGTERVLPIWLRLNDALDTPFFNFKVVRGGST